MATELDLQAFFADRPVFTLAELAEARGETGGLGPARNQVKRHVASGRVKSVARGIYAVVPPGLDAERFQPDPFLVGAAARPEGIFAYHSALELLGAAHSVWHQLTLHCDRRRRPLVAGATRILFLATPAALAQKGLQRLGVREVRRQTRGVPTTGPERTLVECLRQPNHAGGLDEAVESVQGFPLLDFRLLARVLEAYDERALWAAVGWLTERERDAWSTPGEFLDMCRQRRPEQNQYVARGLRGGKLLSEWRLIVPAHLARGFEGSAADR